MLPRFKKELFKNEFILNFGWLLKKLYAIELLSAKLLLNFNWDLICLCVLVLIRENPLILDSSKDGRFELERALK